MFSAMCYKPMKFWNSSYASISVRCNHIATFTKMYSTQRDLKKCSRCNCQIAWDTGENNHSLNFYECRFRKFIFSISYQQFIFWTYGHKRSTLLEVHTHKKVHILKFHTHKKVHILKFHSQRFHAQHSSHFRISRTKIGHILKFVTQKRPYYGFSL